MDTRQPKSQTLKADAIPTNVPHYSAHFQPRPSKQRRMTVNDTTSNTAPIELTPPSSPTERCESPSTPPLCNSQITTPRTRQYANLCNQATQTLAIDKVVKLKEKVREYSKIGYITDF